MVFSAELDDGTGVVRGVFFRRIAEDFLEIKAEELKNDENAFDPTKLLGVNQEIERLSK